MALVADTVLVAGPALALTVFDGGASRGESPAVGSYDERSPVTVRPCSRFSGVEDNLAAVRLLGEEAKQQQAAVTAAQRSLDISLNQYRAGTMNYLQVSTPQTTLLTNQRTGLAVTQRQFVAADAARSCAGQQLERIAEFELIGGLVS